MENKKLLIINAAIAAIAILLWWVFSNWSQWKEDDALGMQFIAVLALAIVFGLLFVTIILPTLGDRIGAYFYSAPEQIEADAYTKAAAKIGQGDYQGAIHDYRAIAKNEPDNRFPIVEIAKIQHDNLKDVDAAIHTLETAVQSKDWEIDDAAFMLFRLHDLYLNDKENKERARELLEMVIEQFPDTRHSANAHHKLHEMDSIG